MQSKEQDFARFKKEFLQWMEFFGLMDWEVSFEWKNTKTSDAHIQAALGARTAVVTFAKDVSRRDSVGLLALHEAIELLLVPLRIHAMERHTTKFQIDEASHAIVQRLLKVFYEGEKGKK